MELYFGIFLIVLILVVLWVIVTYNGFIKMKNRIEEAFSTMDVYLKKRYDLIPNLVETVKGYATHEKSTLDAVISARNMAANATTLEDKIQSENVLSGTLKSLFAIAEAYPDLKANANFTDLQNSLRMIEDEIANSRKYYNAVVKEYNTRTETIPSSLIAGTFHFERKPMFEISDQSERENVRVQF